MVVYDHIYNILYAKHSKIQGIMMGFFSFQMTMRIKSDSLKHSP